MFFFILVLLVSLSILDFFYPTLQQGDNVIVVAVERVELKI